MLARGEEGENLVDDTSGDSGSPVGDYERGIAVMERLWGEAKTAQLREIWRGAHPDVERYITAFALGEVWARPVLDLKTRSLICLAAAVALERQGQIRLHTHGAIHSGATADEGGETVLQLMIYAGFPAAWEALLVVQEVLAEEAAATGGEG